MNLMEEAVEEAERRHQMVKTYNSLIEALKIIGEINMKVFKKAIN